MSEESRSKGLRKCFIPKRLLPAQQRVSNVHLNNTVMHQSQNGLRYMTRPNSCEPHSRIPNRVTEGIGDTLQLRPLSQNDRPIREKLVPAQKKPVLLGRKRFSGDKSFVAFLHKSPPTAITIPKEQKIISKTSSQNKSQQPPQEIIQKCDSVEIKQDCYCGLTCDDMDEILLDFNIESTTSRNEKVKQLKNNWQDKIVEFERLKNELHDKQNTILQICASLRNTKQELTAFGEATALPSIDDLPIMNVANMTPSQLLKICSEAEYKKDIQQSINKILTVDIKKLNDMPSRLISICERSLASRKELIEWFLTLKNQEKGCSKSALSKKINEFSTENDILNSDLLNVKNSFLRDVNEFLRTCCDETLALQKRNQHLKTELSGLNAKNIELKKKVTYLEQQKVLATKVKFEELSKELRDEKAKTQMLKQKLTRVEGQLKIREERILVTESALEQARVQTRNLERTIQQLNEQNQCLQIDFDNELSKLNESMENNTKHLEEIAHAREELQSEKEALKIKLDEVIKHYEDCINDIKHELNETKTKLAEKEEKCKEEIVKNEKLQIEIDFQCVKLRESEFRQDETMKQLQQTELALNDLVNCKHDFEKIKQELEDSEKEVKKYTNRIKEQNNDIQELRRNLHNAHELEKKLVCDINKKDEYIKKLEREQLSLHQKCEANEHKIEKYEEQLIILKNHMTKLKEQFGDFENINDLQEMISKQHSQLNDARRQNNELFEEIQKKKNELELLTKTIAEQDYIIKEKNISLQRLSEKEEEREFCLRLSAEIEEKNNKIESLITSIETRNQQISQLEKIILKMEKNNQTYSTQKQKDQELIQALENKVIQYENFIENKNKEPTLESLDDLIKILEDEIDIPLDSHLIYYTDKNNIRRDDLHALNSEHIHESKNIPTKIVTGNFLKKIYLTNNDNKNKDHNFDEQVINNITRKWITKTSSTFKDDFVMENEGHAFNQAHRSNVYFIIPNEIHGEKKSKILKLAGHRVP